MSDKVSIVIPIYNSEEHINKCVESCIGQSFSNLEIIAVDDGSNDGTLLLINELAKVDSRIVVVQKANEGVSKARNDGILKSTGDYLFFLDSDDWLEPLAIEELIKCALRDNSDIVVSGFYSVKNKKIDSTEQYPDKNINVQEFCSLFLKKELQGGLTGKLYRKDKWKIDGFDLEYSLKNNEDYLMLIKYIISIDRISLISYVGYNYFRRYNSASNQKRPSVADDIITATLRIESILRKQIFLPQIEADLSFFFAQQLFAAITCNKYCYKDTRFKYLYSVSENSFRYIKNIRMRVILNSFRFGVIPFHSTIFFINAMVSMKVYICKLFKNTFTK